MNKWRVRARKMPMQALYKGNTADAALLSKKCSMQQHARRAKRYIIRKSFRRVLIVNC